MAIKIVSTKDVSMDGVKVLVYGRSGAGKTFLSSTAPSPFIISAESGLLSLAEYDIPSVDIQTVKALEQTFDWCEKSQEAEQYQTIVLDSITEIAEVMLRDYKQQFKDPRQAYGLMNDNIAHAIRKFRDLKGKHVYFTAKLLRQQDESSGAISYLPDMPGRRVLNGMPFFFDLVLALRIGKDKDGEYRYLQTQPDIQWEAKDRSGKLESKEAPDLGKIFTKIGGDK